MKYHVQIITINENWSTYATTDHKSYADEIASDLVARNHVVRITEWESTPKFGPILSPVAMDVINRETT